MLPMTYRNYHVVCSKMRDRSCISKYIFFRWGSWWRHCTTSRKDAGSFPDGVIGIFNDIILPAALWPLCRLSL